MSKMNRRLFAAFFVAIIFYGCFGSRQISSENLSSLYHQGEHLFHPEFFVHHFTNDSSCLYLKLNTDEFLKVRQPEDGFKAAFSIQCKLMESYESAVLLDSAHADFTVSPAENENPNKATLYTINFKIPKQGNF